MVKLVTSIFEKASFHAANKNLKDKLIKMGIQHRKNLNLTKNLLEKGNPISNIRKGL